MTTDYSAMEAGRELDAIVAERVMGHDVFSIGNDETGLQEAGGMLTRNLALYSTSIEAAWQVVSSRPLGVWNWRFSQDDSGDWWAEIRLGYATSYSKGSLAHCTSLPLAICRAALLATQGERK